MPAHWHEQDQDRAGKNEPAGDFEHRRRASRFSYKIVPQDEYYDAYREQWLNSYDALEAYRRAGIETPSAPPEGP